MPARLKPSLFPVLADRSAPRTAHLRRAQTDPKLAGSTGGFGFVLLLSLAGLILSLLLLMQVLAIADQDFADLLMLLS